MEPKGTVKILTSDNDEFSWQNEQRARKAMRKRFGRVQDCLHCGEPMLDVRREPSRAFPLSEFHLREITELHQRKLSAAARNRDACVFRVVDCRGNGFGHVAVLKKGTGKETERRAYRSMVKRFGTPDSCGQCGDTTHRLEQVRGPSCW